MVIYQTGISIAFPSHSKLFVLRSTEPIFTKYESTRTHWEIELRMTSLTGSNAITGLISSLHYEHPYDRIEDIYGVTVGACLPVEIDDPNEATSYDLYANELVEECPKVGESIYDISFSSSVMPKDVILKEITYEYKLIFTGELKKKSSRLTNSK